MSYLSRLITTRNLCSLKNNTNIIIRTYIFKPQIKKPIINCNVNQIRHRSLFKRFKRISPEKYRLKDNIPESFELIYRNTMDKYILAAQIFSSLAYVMLGIVIIKISSTYGENPQISFEYWEKKPKAVENEIYLYLVGLAFFAVAMQYLVIRTPLRIYNNPKLHKYIFINYSNIPFSKSTLACSRKEISKLPDLGVIPWFQNRYDVKNTPMILVENFFRTPADLFVMLGEQEHYDD